MMGVYLNVVVTSLLYTTIQVIRWDYCEWKKSKMLYQKSYRYSMPMFDRLRSYALLTGTQSIIFVEHVGIVATI